MDINFIITCYDKEDYWPYMKQILDSYKIVKPHIVLCYNGNRENFVCDYRCNNSWHARGEHDLMKGGYDLLKNNGINKWVKLSVDSWLLDENVIIDIFNRMVENNYCYAGNYWSNELAFATDIIFAIENNFNLFEKFFERYLITDGFESAMAETVKDNGKYYLIPERQPVNSDINTHRFYVDALSWTMDHNLNVNIQRAKNYIAKLKEKSIIITEQ